MYIMAELWPTSAIAPRKVLDIALKHLRKDLFNPAYSSNDSVTSSEAFIVLSSISAISKLAFRTTARGDMPALAGMIAKNWYHVYKWILPFTDAFIRSSPHTDPRRAVIVTHFTRLFRVFTTNDELLNLLLKEDSSLEIATQLWLYSSAADKIISLDPATGHGSRMFYNYAIRCTPEQLLTVAPLCGGVDAFTERVLGSLALILDEGERTECEGDFWDVVSYNLFIIGHITTNKLFHRAFLCSSAIPLVLSALTKMVKFIESLKGSGNVSSAPNTALVNALTFLNNSFVQPDGYKWFAQAVRGGLLEMVHSTAANLSLLPYASYDAVRQFLWLLPTLLVHRSAIISARTALAATDIWPRAPYLKYNDVRDYWATLVYMIELRSGVLGDFEEEESARRSSVACENPKVSDPTLLCRQIHTENDLFYTSVSE